MGWGVNIYDMADNNEKVPIDRYRDSAGSIEIDPPDDDSEVIEMLSADGSLLALKGRGVYKITLADDIDPKRTNLNIPKITYQRVLPYGSDHELVGKILITAGQLLKTGYLAGNIDREKALVLAFRATKNIAGMFEFSERVKSEQDAVLQGLDRKIRSDGSFPIPSLTHVEAVTKEFIQKAYYGSGDLLEIVRVFYPNMKSKGWNYFTHMIESETNSSDNFGEFLLQSLPLLDLIRNARNCIQHADKHQKMRVAVTDFSINEHNELVPPTIEVVHSETPLDKMPVSVFMSEVYRNILSIAELVLVFLCARHVQPIAGISFGVVEIPEDRRRSPHARYGYGWIDEKNNYIPLA